MSGVPDRNEVLWTERVRSLPMITFVIALIGVITMVTILLNPTARPEKQIQGAGWYWFIGSMVLAAAAVATFLWANIEVRRDGLFISFGPLGWPKQRMSWTRVVKVESLIVQPTLWGGWGYRWVPWKKATAIVMRKGPGLKFDLSNGRVFVITVDDPNGALDAIQTALHPESEKNCDHDHH